MKLETLISEREIPQKTKELGARISQDYSGKEVTVICVLKGGVMFMVDLVKQITVPLKMDFMVVSSYGNEFKSTGVVRIVKDLDESITNQHVIIVEDIIDSGRTLNYLIKILKERNPASIEICTLLDKPEQRIAQVDAKYVGFAIENHFVLGYGLDYQQLYRNLPYIAINKE